MTKYSHRPIEWRRPAHNYDPAKDRGAYYNGDMIARVRQVPQGPLAGQWEYFPQWSTPTSQQGHAPTLQEALAAVKAAHTKTGYPLSVPATLAARDRRKIQPSSCYAARKGLEVIKCDTCGQVMRITQHGKNYVKVARSRDCENPIECSRKALDATGFPDAMGLPHIDKRSD